MYKLLLFVGDTIELDKGVNSRDMLVSSLYKEFKELGVEVIPYSVTKEESREEFINNMPRCDFLLIRLFTASWEVQNVDLYRHKIKNKIVSFIEHRQEGMDYCFGYLKAHNPDTYIPFPYPGEYMVNYPKSKSILLDGTSQEGNLEKISNWIKPLQDYKIYSLTNSPTSFIPIKTSSYKDYMEQTKEMQFFIPCHAGSYEHSIVDMVGRGITVPVYKEGERYLIPKEMVEDLELPTYTNQEELLEIIRNHKPKDVLHKMTPMKDVTQVLHKKFLEWVE